MLTACGCGSRRKMADAIKQGRVAVNGVLAEGFRQPVADFDVVTLDGRPLDVKAQEKVYLLMNKPAGFVSTASDELGRQTVLDILPPKYRRLRLYPAGRLDKDTTGLLLLTNDGELTRRLTHPSSECEKEYLVYIKEMLTPVEIKKLATGIELDGSMTHPAKLRLAQGGQPCIYRVVIHEGRKRQVRRMFLALGHRTLALKRVRVGKLELKDLPEGQVRELAPREVRDI